MTRQSYPEPDRWYLPAIQIIEYDIDAIRKVLRLGTNDPIPAFRQCYLYAKQLDDIIRIAAINQERKEFPNKGILYDIED